MTVIPWEISWLDSDLEWNLILARWITNSEYGFATIQARPKPGPSQAQSIIDFNLYYYIISFYSQWAFFTLSGAVILMWPYPGADRKSQIWDKTHSLTTDRFGCPGSDRAVVRNYSCPTWPWSDSVFRK